VRLIDQPFTVEQKQSNTYIFKLQETLNNRRNLLRCRQIEAIEATITMLRKNIFSGLIKLPTGTGKTRLFAEMSGALDLSTLVLIPRVSLFRDTQIEFENLKKEGIISPDYYIQTIGGENKGSSSDQLKSILLAIDDNKPGVIVCTYQSLDSIAKSNPELFELLIHKIDLLVSDEAHRSLGKKTKKHIKVLSETERINTTRIS
jgi:superfamily II DNA or RNA helicase